MKTINDLKFIGVNPQGIPVALDSKNNEILLPDHQLVKYSDGGMVLVDSDHQPVIEF